MLSCDRERKILSVGRARGVSLPKDYAEKRLEFFDTPAPEMTA